MGPNLGAPVCTRFSLERFMDVYPAQIWYYNVLEMNTHVSIGIKKDPKMEVRKRTIFLAIIYGLYGR